MKKTYIKSKKGFSLVEVLISMAVLSLGLSALTILMVNSIRESANAKNQIIATGLAEEGVEIVTNLRDNNVDTFKSGGTVTDGYYGVEVYSSYGGFPSTKDNSAYWRLYLKTAGPYFYSIQNVAGSQQTNYSRRIQITNMASGQIRVVSYVTWDSSGNFPTTCNTANKCVSVTSILLDN